jgi:hypothetical protein
MEASCPISGLPFLMRFGCLRLKEPAAQSIDMTRPSGSDLAKSIVCATGDPDRAGLLLPSCPNGESPAVPVAPTTSRMLGKFVA